MKLLQLQRLHSAQAARVDSTGYSHSARLAKGYTNTYRLASCSQFLAATTTSFIQFETVLSGFSDGCTVT